MARLAALDGARLAPSTLSDIRSARRVPRPESLDAFVTACLRKAAELKVVVPTPLDDREEWRRLREAAAHATSSSSGQASDLRTNAHEEVDISGQVRWVR